MKTRVFNLIILDESGSMSCIERQALTGVNETLQTIRRAQEKYPEQEQYVTFVPFQTGSIKFVRDCEPISEVKDLESKDYNPGTCTPLYDAIGLSVNHLKKNVSENDSVLVTIITDGYENDSHEFTSRDISRMVEEMKSKGWLFTYIGANQDAIEVAKTMNIKNALNFVQDEAGTRSMFARERRSRESFMDKVFNCCYAMSPKESQAMRQKLADSDDFFKVDDKS
ncbi:MAG: VWA domain-containing protein [Bacteroidales bacterium]|nr:VWA domain-containing protein [Bacteroidales bacterium]